MRMIDAIKWWLSFRRNVNFWDWMKDTYSANPFLTLLETLYASSISYDTRILRVALHLRREGQTMSFFVPPGLGSKASAV